MSAFYANRSNTKPAAEQYSSGKSYASRSYDRKIFARTPAPFPSVRERPVGAVVRAYYATVTVADTLLIAGRGLTLLTATELNANQSGASQPLPFSVGWETFGEAALPGTFAMMTWMVGCWGRCPQRMLPNTPNYALARASVVTITSLAAVIMEIVQTRNANGNPFMIALLLQCFAQFALNLPILIRELRELWRECHPEQGPADQHLLEEGRPAVDVAAGPNPGDYDAIPDAVTVPAPR